MPKGTKTHDNGPYSKLLSLLYNETGVSKERLAVERMPAEGALVKGVPVEATLESAPRSRCLQSGREF